MLTSSDIKKLKTIFAIRQDLRDFESKFYSKFATKSEMISGFDAVMHELRAIREELTLGGYRRLDRISTVEAKLSF